MVMPDCSLVERIFSRHSWPLQRIATRVISIVTFVDEECTVGGVDGTLVRTLVCHVQVRAIERVRSNLPKRQPLADVLKTYCLKSRSSLIGTAGGNMLSYMARASLTKRAHSSSDFGINRMTSPIFAPNLIGGRVKL